MESDFSSFSCLKLIRNHCLCTVDTSFNRRKIVWVLFCQHHRLRRVKIFAFLIQRYYLTWHYHITASNSITKPITRIMWSWKIKCLVMPVDYESISEISSMSKESILMLSSIIEWLLIRSRTLIRKLGTCRLSILRKIFYFIYKAKSNN